MTDADIDVLVRWNQDPEVLYFSEGDDVQSRSRDEVERIYGGVSQSAFMFMIEHEGRAIGECWLQDLNLARLQDAFRGRDCRRIDLVIGEKALWGRGLGSEAIRALIDFGFGTVGADVIFGCGVADYNGRSRRAFERIGFREFDRVREPSGAKASFSYDFVMVRDDWEGARLVDG